MSNSVSTGRPIHVSLNGDDHHEGCCHSPLRTIFAAARLAQPGDTVTVHAGTFRERIDPPRGGESDERRIVYQAAAGERVIIKGSEIINTWQQVQDDVWSVRIPNEFFGDFNPYRDALRGHWFIDKGRQHHCGAVYLNGHWLTEAVRQEDVFAPVGSNPLWFGMVDAVATTLWAQFKGINPNDGQVEINVRKTVFYPSKPGVNYITVRGFTLCHAATPWSPPTTEQIGCLGVNWSKGWVIENNVISYSVCAGITLGKYHDPQDFPDRDIVEGTEGGDTYHGTIDRALKHGWNTGNIGHHVIRNNTISHCEMAGIAGSFGAICSLVTGNTIHDIHVRQLFFGYEQAGIKFHGAIDTEISRNRIFRCYRGLWLDWMSQGTRVTRNLLYDNGDQHDLFVEVNHGPFVVDNNLFLSKRSVQSVSHGGCYAHNLFLGSFEAEQDLKRSTPYHKAHSTELAGFLNVQKGDDRLFNNLVAEAGGLSSYDDAIDPVFMDGNIYLAGAKPCRFENTPSEQPCFDNGSIQVEDKGDEVFLRMVIDPVWVARQSCALVTTERLGRTKVAELPYEDTDGAPLRMDIDYLGNSRKEKSPVPGPFEVFGGGGIMLKVWPIHDMSEGDRNVTK